MADSRVGSTSRLDLGGCGGDTGLGAAAAGADRNGSAAGAGADMKGSLVCAKHGIAIVQRTNAPMQPRDFLLRSNCLIVASADGIVYAPSRVSAALAAG
jgi:hypothetical protein